MKRDSDGAMTRGPSEVMYVSCQVQDNSNRTRAGSAPPAGDQGRGEPIESSFQAGSPGEKGGWLSPLGSHLHTLCPSGGSCLKAIWGEAECGRKQLDPAQRADGKKKAHQDQLKPSAAAGREQDKWKQRGSITRNLCTNVKQLERSQGPDSTVPMCHGSDMAAKPPNNHSFLLPRSAPAVILVSYISSQAADCFIQTKREPINTATVTASVKINMALLQMNKESAEEKSLPKLHCPQHFRKHGHFLKQTVQDADLKRLLLANTCGGVIILQPAELQMIEQSFPELSTETTDTTFPHLTSIRILQKEKWPWLHKGSIKTELKINPSALNLLRLQENIGRSPEELTWPPAAPLIVLFTEPGRLFVPRPTHTVRITLIRDIKMQMTTDQRQRKKEKRKPMHDSLQRENFSFKKSQSASLYSSHNVFNIESIYLKANHTPIPNIFSPSKSSQKAFQQSIGQIREHFYFDPSRMKRNKITKLTQTKHQSKHQKTNKHGTKHKHAKTCKTINTPKPKVNNKTQKQNQRRGLSYVPATILYKQKMSIRCANNRILIQSKNGNKAHQNTKGNASQQYQKDVTALVLKGQEQMSNRKHNRSSNQYEFPFISNEKENSMSVQTLALRFSYTDLFGRHLLALVPEQYYGRSSHLVPQAEGLHAFATLISFVEEIRGVEKVCFSSKKHIFEKRTNPLLSLCAGKLLSPDTYGSVTFPKT
ncbi:hypothetical protein DNTS_028275 [Danionella cerebrum]|uniref:Uncharacterized protein n=1 Tax=Danionella cerebrum TaxID=2873325 RepID=A0A553QDK8_9TELE|nr:hypothetical protein DNTS_028275 [Danionella translucida]